MDITHTRPILESSAISYNNNQSVDPDLCDGVFSPIFLIGIEKFLSSDAQNITCSLLRIETFIKQHFLSNKLAKNFLELIEVSAISWQLINTIYKSGWDRLTVDKNNMFFQRYMLAYFVVKLIAVSSALTPFSNLSKSNKSKLTNTINNKKLYA